MREVVAELKSLRLHGMAERYEALLAEGGVGIQSAGWLIQCLLDAEVTDRHGRSIRYQMAAARFPIHRDLAGFDFGRSRVDEKLIDQLATADFTDSAANVIFIGGTVTLLLDLLPTFDFALMRSECRSATDSASPCGDLRE